MDGLFEIHSIAPACGTLTFGRQVTLLLEGTIKYDPNYNATTFGLLGASNTYSGGGAQEDNRLDSTLRYSIDFEHRAHLGALYKFNDSHGSANSVFQADVGGEYAGASIDASTPPSESATSIEVYSKVEYFVMQSKWYTLSVGSRQRREASTMNKYPIAWSGIVPIAMSLTLLLLMWTGRGVLGVNPLPIHDEDAIDHIGMLLMYGQVPAIAYFVFGNRRQIKRMLPLVGVQLSLWAIILGGVYRVEYINKKQVALRIEKHAPFPGSEVTLRRYIESEQSGRPEYDSMSPGVARYVGKFLAVTQPELRSLGPLQSLAFKGIDRIGWDIYNAHFTGEDQEWRIFIAADGKTAGLTLSTGRSGCQSSEPYECR